MKRTLCIRPLCRADYGRCKELMAQVHALLFISPEPLDAEEISKLLDVSRSNVSTSLRELIAWGVVRRVHLIGGRRDKFEALKDVMETFRVIMAERKRRELDPTVTLLEKCIDDTKKGGSDEDYTREQLEKMLEFLQFLSLWYAQVDQLSSPALQRLLHSGAKIASFFGSRSRPEPPRDSSQEGVAPANDEWDDEDLDPVDSPAQLGTH